MSYHCRTWPGVQCRREETPRCRSCGAQALHGLGGKCEEPESVLRTVRLRESFASSIVSGRPGERVHLWIGIDDHSYVIGQEFVEIDDDEAIKDAVAEVIAGFVPPLDHSARVILHGVCGTSPRDWEGTMAIDAPTQHGHGGRDAAQEIVMKRHGRACVPIIEDHDSGDLQPSSMVLTECTGEIPEGWADLGDVRHLTPPEIIDMAQQATGLHIRPETTLVMKKRWVVALEVTIPDDPVRALWKGMTPWFAMPSPNEVYAPVHVPRGGPGLLAMTPLAVWAKLQPPPIRRPGAYFHGCVTAVVARQDSEGMEAVQRAARQLFPPHSEFSSFDATATIADRSAGRDHAVAGAGAGAETGGTFNRLREVFQDEWGTPRAVVVDIGAASELAQFAATSRVHSEPAWHVILALPLDTLASCPFLKDVDELLAELRRWSKSYVTVVDAIAIQPHDDRAVPPTDDPAAWGQADTCLPCECDGRLQLVPATAEGWGSAKFNEELRKWTEEGTRPPWFVFHTHSFGRELGLGVHEAVDQCLARPGCTEVRLMKSERGCGATGLLRSTLVALTRNRVCCCWVSALAMPTSPDDVEQQRRMVAALVLRAVNTREDRVVIGLDDDTALAGPDNRPHGVGALIQREEATALLVQQFRKAVVETSVCVCFLRVVPAAVNTWAAGRTSSQQSPLVISGHLTDAAVDHVTRFFETLYPGSDAALRTARKEARRSPPRSFGRHLCLFAWTALRGEYERLTDTVQRAWKTLRDTPRNGIIRSLAFAAAYSPVHEGVNFPGLLTEESGPVHEACLALLTRHHRDWYNMRHPVIGDVLLKHINGDRFFENPRLMAQLWVECIAARVGIDPMDAFITRGTNDRGQPFLFSRFVRQFFRVGCGEELDPARIDEGGERCQTAHWFAWALFHPDTRLGPCAAHVLLSRLHRAWAARSAGHTSALRAEDAVWHANLALEIDDGNRSARNSKALALFQLGGNEHIREADQILNDLFEEAAEASNTYHMRRNASNALRELESRPFVDDLIEKWQKRLDGLGGAIHDAEDADWEPARLLVRRNIT